MLERRQTDAHGKPRFNLALAFFVPPAFTNIQWKTYMIFGTFCAVMTVHVFFLYPETAGRSLEEIDSVFEGRVPACRSAHVGGTFQDRVRAAKEQNIPAEKVLQGDQRQIPKASGEADDATHHETV